jgi:hypothetical protein
VGFVDAAIGDKPDTVRRDLPLLLQLAYATSSLNILAL